MTRRKVFRGLVRETVGGGKDYPSATPARPARPEKRVQSEQNQTDIGRDDDAEVRQDADREFRRRKRRKGDDRK